MRWRAVALLPVASSGNRPSTAGPGRIRSAQLLFVSGARPARTSPGGRPGAAASQGRPRPGRAEQPAARTRRPACPRACREQGRRGRARSASPVSSRPTATSGRLSNARRKTLDRHGIVGVVHDRALGQAGVGAHAVGSARAARGPFPGRQEPRAGSQRRHGPRRHDRSGAPGPCSPPRRTSPARALAPPSPAR